VVQNLGVVGTGNGTAGPYTLNFGLLPAQQSPNPPLDGFLRGHIDISGIIATGVNQDPPIVNNLSFAGALALVPTTSIESQVYITSIDATGANVIVADSGFFLQGNVNYGMLMTPGPAPFEMLFFQEDTVQLRI